MISGDGFFVTKSGNQQLYTRAGSFDFDGTGRLVTPDGNLLQGWMATNGVVNTNGPIGDLSVPFGQSLAPAATTNSQVTGNLSAHGHSGRAGRLPVHPPGSHVPLVGRARHRRPDRPEPVRWAAHGERQLPRRRRWLGPGIARVLLARERRIDHRRLLQRSPAG